MAPMTTSLSTNSTSQGSASAFADAISQVIEEMRDDEDKKSRFYREVMATACRLRLSDEPVHQSLVSADDLSRYIKDLESQHRKKSFTRRVFKSLQPLVDGLLQYTSAVDIMVQADPTVSSLIYGGAKLVLQIASGYSRYFEKISEMMADIGDSLLCFHIYSNEFSSNVKMNGILIRSYKEILGFWREASRILDQKGARFLIGGLFAPFEASYTKFKEKLDRNTRLVDSVAQALNIQDQGNFRRAQEMGARAAGELTKKLERASSFPREQHGQIITKHEEIRKWIAGGRSSRIDPANDLERHLSSKHVGTCEWVFNNSTFSHWRTSGKDDVLWVHAAPGAGKSVLCSTIIDRLKSDKEHSNVLYFFCRFDDPDKCRAISGLRSIALQALKLIQYVPDELYQLYREEYSSDDKYMATLIVAERVVEFLLKRIEHVYVIVDGLCECQDGTLVDSLIRISGKKGLGITKWLFTSRNELEICRKFQRTGAETLSVSKAVVQKDIRKYLDDNADLLFGTKDQLDRLTALSQGNFLSIRLTIEPLRNEEVTCEEEFEETLRNFQPELGQCWYRSLQKLTQRKETIQELARTIFNAVALAAQPMTFNELVDFLSIEIDHDPSTGRQRKKAVILSACAPFVELDYDENYLNPTVRLAHKTVGEFLSQDPTTMGFISQDCYKFFVNEESGNLELGKKCLTYLSYRRYSNPDDLAVLVDCQKLQQEHAFLTYSAVFWHRHSDLSGGSRELFERVREFLRSPNIWTCIRVQSKYAPHLFARLSYSDTKDAYKMHSPDSCHIRDNPEKVYYADALPTWVDKYDDKGDDLIWGYHMFIREWAEVLIRRPELIQCYFAKVLGQRSFWSTKHCSTDAIRVFILEEYSLARQVMLFTPEAQRTKKSSKVWFDLTPNGLKANVAIFNETAKEIIKFPIVVLEEWQIDIRSDSCGEALPTLTHLGHVHLCHVDTPMPKRVNPLPHLSITPACLDLGQGKQPQELAIDDPSQDDISLLAIQVDQSPSSDYHNPGICRGTTNPSVIANILISDLLEERLWSVYQRMQTSDDAYSEKLAFPPALEYIQNLLESHKHVGIWEFCNKKSVTQRGVKATVYSFRVVEESSKAASEDSDETSNSDTEGDSETEMEPTIGARIMRFLSVTKSDGQPHWYHDISKSLIVHDPLPFLDKTASCLLWPQDKSSLLIVDLSTWENIKVAVREQEHAKQPLVALEYRFSSNSDLLHRASIYIKHRRLVKITQAFFKFTYNTEDPSSASVIPTSHITQETTWYSTTPSHGLGCPFAWVDETLYAALGSFEITILRFPPPYSLPSPGGAHLPGVSKVQTLPKPLFIPATTPSRDLRFFVQLNPSTSSRTAIFCLNSMPVLALPPVVLAFDMEKAGGPWEEYRPCGEDEIDKFDCGFLKGMYAAKEQAFSMPIRSGLEWRKSTYVTCW